MSLIEKIFRFEQRRLKKLEKITKKVLAYEDKMAALTDEELQAKQEFRERLAKGKH